MVTTRKRAHSKLVDDSQGGTATIPARTRETAPSNDSETFVNIDRAKRQRTRREAIVGSSVKGAVQETHRVDGMEGGEVYYLPTFIEVDEASQWYSELEALDSYYHPTLKVYGKDVKQSRSIAAYASDDSIVVKYSGHTVTMNQAYPAILQRIQGVVEERLDEGFNHMMLNRYADGNEYIGRHRDTAQNKVIASLSLGAERTIGFIKNKTGEVVRLKLAHGSLLVMTGDTQKNWKHEIPKEPIVKESRISLTFRQISS